MELQEIIEECFTKILRYQHHIDSVYAAQHSIENFKDNDPGNLLEHLYAAQNREWRNLFMFGLVSNEPIRDRIKAAAYENFLSDRIHVASYFTKSSSWMSADEKDFRRMCCELFAPKIAKEEDKKLLKELELKAPNEKLDMSFYKNEIE
jgi:hypothetical protein